MPEEGHQRLAVGLGAQRSTAEVLELPRICRRPLVQNLGEVLKDGRAEEGADHPSLSPLEAEVPVQLFFIKVCREVGSAVIPPDVDPASMRKGLKQSGLAGA